MAGYATQITIKYIVVLLQSVSKTLHPRPSVAIKYVNFLSGELFMNGCHYLCGTVSTPGVSKRDVVSMVAMG